jgi:NAD-dependent deacetylase
VNLGGNVMNNSIDIPDLISSAKSICVFTGAGISAESGIPTFRDTGGLWENYEPEDFVTPEGYHRDPVVVWRWHMWLRSLSIDAAPNRAHTALAEIENETEDFLIITQNIDNLHERAGSKNISKLHGDIMQMVCAKNNHITNIEGDIDYKNIINKSDIPTCPICGSDARPNVVWFGEMLPTEPLSKAYDFAQKCKVFIIIGTSGVVSGGYGFTEMAKQGGAYVIEINPSESALSSLSDYIIREPATVGIEKLFKK